MDLKAKLLDALDIVLDDVSEERLLDILLDAYKSKNKRIAELEGENAHERERMRIELEMVRSERHVMRRDPLYCAAGEYFFACRDRYFGVRIQGNRIDAFERQKGIDFAARQLSPKEASEL